MVRRSPLSIWLALCCLVWPGVGGAAGGRAARPLRGAAVVARSPAARADAKALARTVYAERRLRPAMDEALARALVGEPPRNPPSTGGQPHAAPAPAEVLSTVRAIETADAAVRRRLLASLGRDLGMALMVVVARDGEVATARVLRVAEQRYLPLSLTPGSARATAAGGAGAGAGWSDAVPILIAALASKPAGRRQVPAAAPARPAPAAAAPGAQADEPSGGFDWLASPWFWGGFGVVAAVGITVIVLSQTAMNEPDTVLVDGRVGP